MSVFEVLQDITDAAHDFVDAYFIQSDMKDINLSAAERSQAAHFDALATDTARNCQATTTPIGKTVL